MKFGTTLALLALALHLAAVSAEWPGLADVDTWAKEHCPPGHWLVEYAKYHRANRHKPGQRYMVYECASGACMGLGDRVRGILYLIRLAEASGRILLIHHQRPMPLANLLAPNVLDWVPTPEQVPLIMKPEARVGRTNKDLETRSWHNLTDVYLTEKTNAHVDTPTPNTRVLSAGNLEEMHCAMTMLFKPSEKTLKTRLRILQDLNMDPEKPFVAIHMRMFGMHGEDDYPAGFAADALPKVLSSIMCAKKLAASNGIPVYSTDAAPGSPEATANPILLVTDHMYLRQFVADGMLGHEVVTGAFTPRHIDHDDGNPDFVEDHYNTVGELVTMSTAKCLIISTSGFSNMAMYLGRHACRTSIGDCISAHWKIQTEPPKEPGLHRRLLRRNTTRRTHHQPRR